MADNIRELSNLLQQTGYYDAGGKDPGERSIDKINNIFSTAGKGVDQYNSVIDDVLKQKKMKLENKGAQQGQASFGDTVGATTMSSLPPDAQALSGVPMNQFEKVAQGIKLLRPATPADVLPVSSLPEEAKARAIAAGFPENGTIDLKKFNALKTTDPSAPVDVMQSSQGVAQGKVAGNTKLVGDPALGIGGYAGVKQQQNILQSLPSRASQGTLPAQASGVQLAARQLKALIATPGSYQRLGLAKGDLARMVLRAAPQQEVLKDAGFSDTVINHINVLRQKISSDPAAIDQPLIRKELYDIGTELERSSRPVLERSLNEVERSYKSSLPAEWPKTRAEELGENFPDIPFQETEIPSAMGSEQSPKPGGVLHVDDQGNKAWMYSDGTYDEVK